MAFACDPCCPESLVLATSNVELTGITSDRVEVKNILHVSSHDVLLWDQPLFTDVTEQPAPEPEPGILLCFSQPGESLWEIAKRYRVSCDSLRRMNPALEEGDGAEQVILWRR